MEKEFSIPEEFLVRMKTLLKEAYPAFLKALAAPAPVSVRVNPFKDPGGFGKLEKVPWCKRGFYLSERPSFTTDPLFQGGAYYVQEASSMFLEQVMEVINRKGENIKVLDVSAAPGGKSTHLLSLLSPDALLVSNEVIRARVGMLEENLLKWGCSNFIITNNDPADFKRLAGFFDIILVDAPCSGEGMFRKDKDSSSHWNPSNVSLCVSRQERILNDILPALKPGGHLIYSTCTWNLEENENNLKHLTGQGDFASVRIPFSDDWGIEETETSIGNRNLYAYRFYPHKVRGEGFFISCLQKNDLNSDKFSKSKKIPKFTRASSNDKQVAEKWLNKPDNFEFIVINDQVFAIRKSYFDHFLQLRESLYIKAAGLKMGKIIRNELIPSHDLALSTEISPNIPAIELELNDAIDYLRKADMQMDPGINPGWTIVKYKGLNLGWIKILKNRVNNYFPMDLRIRK